MNFTRSTNFQKREQKTRLNKHLGKLVMVAAVGMTAAVVSTGLWQPSFSQGLSPVEKETLEVRVKDHREAIGDFVKLDVTVDTLRISPKSGLKFWQMGWKDLKPSLEKIDLTQYTGTRAATIFQGKMTPGSFEGVHLKLKGIEGTLKKTKSKVPVKNLVGPIQVKFSINPKEATLIVLDLAVMEMNDHPPGGYELHIKGYELYSSGKLVDKVPPG